MTVTRWEPRFGLYVVAFDGPIQGELRAFVRPAPATQPSARAVASVVDAQAWRGKQLLVVGGSRGLGELTAKIAAAGGADVTLTYASGARDAEAIAADINSLGRGPARVVALDVLADDWRALDGMAGRLDAVCFFATPRIQRRRAGVFRRESFDRLAEFYLDRMASLCCWLEQHARTKPPLRVYFPSTVFIDERPVGMTEYTMVKAAAEVLAADLNRQLHHVRVLHSRLPRLATDQTAGIRGLSPQANVAVLRSVVELTLAQS